VLTPTKTHRPKPALLFPTLFEVENIQNDVGVAVPQNNVSANHDPVAVGRRRGQLPLQIDWNGILSLLQARRQRAANDELLFEAGRQPVFFGESGREIAIVGSVPTANFVAVMIAKTVAAAVVIVVVIPILIPPVAIAVMIPVVTVFAVTIREDGAACYRKHSRHKNSEPFIRSQ